MLRAKNTTSTTFFFFFVKGTFKMSFGKLSYSISQKFVSQLHVLISCSDPLYSIPKPDSQSIIFSTFKGNKKSWEYKKIYMLRQLFFCTPSKEKQIVFHFSTSVVKIIMTQGNLYIVLFMTELFRPALGKAWAELQG